MTRRKKYQEHLQSKEWKELRDLALDRTTGFCQFCGKVATQVHHVKYPKQFGEEHPNSLIPVCKDCHNTSHGIQEMKELHDATKMTDLSPNGIKLKYLLSGGRVYASCRSWISALHVPETMHVWFESGLSRTAIIKKDLAGGSLEKSYLNIPVYRWHAVAELLRAFDRQFYNNQYANKTKYEIKKINTFHENYERIVSWGYDLQERALSSILNPVATSNTNVTQETLIETMKEIVAPRLQAHDKQLDEHTTVITEIKNAVPSLRDENEFITIKQAISEQGLDGNAVPFHPQSNENLSGRAGRLLKEKAVKQGDSQISRSDGQSLTIQVNTYRRQDIYEILKEASDNKQIKLL